MRTSRWLAISTMLLAAACSPALDQPGISSTSMPQSTSSVTEPPSTTSTTPGVTSSTADDVDVATDALVVIGDWGSGTAPQGSVAGAVRSQSEQVPVRAILTTGDNFYADDLDFIMNSYGWVEQGGIEWWMAWGNHDIDGVERENAIANRFDAPKWIVREWGIVDILILDSNQIESVEQQQFLEQTLSQSERPTVAVFHHPAYSCSRHGSNQAVIDQWVSAFDDDVFLVLNGHDHAYQRFEAGGITYVVTGGGGRRLYAIEACPAGHPEMISGQAIHHYLVLTQTADAVHIEAIDVIGEPIDSFDLPIG